MDEQSKEVEVARQFALDWLNRFGDNPLPDGYFTRVDVMFDSKEEEPILLLELDSDDDGGAARMLCYLVDGEVRWGAWYFDGTWGEMQGR
jgi:hypothetical protein